MIIQSSCPQSPYLLHKILYARILLHSTSLLFLLEGLFLMKPLRRGLCHCNKFLWHSGGNKWNKVNFGHLFSTIIRAFSKSKKRLSNSRLKFYDPVSVSSKNLENGSITSLIFSAFMYLAISLPKFLLYFKPASPSLLES